MKNNLGLVDFFLNKIKIQEIESCDMVSNFSNCLTQTSKAKNNDTSPGLEDSKNPILNEKFNSFAILSSMSKKYKKIFSDIYKKKKNKSKTLSQVLKRYI